MLPGYSPVTQALLGTLFTWGLTAAGAALVFVFSSRQKRILDGSLGFAAGEAKVESCILRNMTRQTALLNTHPLNLEASRTNVSEGTPLN